MIHLKYLWLFSLLIVLAIITFFLLRLQEPSKNATAPSHLKTSQKELLRSFGGQSQAATVPLSKSVDAWDVWIEKKTEVLLAFAISDFYKQRPDALPLEPSQIEKMKASFRAQIADQAALLKNERTSPPSISSSFETKHRTPKIERYTGVQTVAAIMETFDEVYNRHHKDTVADAKYPRNEWIAMLLDQGITIETTQDYWRYLGIREDLAHLENNSDTWGSGGHGITPTDDWETYKSAYKERKIWETQQIQQAQQADPSVISGLFGGPDHQMFLPIKRNTLYVKRQGMKASFLGASLRNETQEFNLIFRGIEPEGYDIIYLDSNDNILSEPPSPITREELLNAGGSPLPEGWWEGDFSQQPPTDFQTDVFTQETPENQRTDLPLSPVDTRQNVQEQIEQGLQNTEKILEQFTKNDSEILSELEKQLTPELPSAEDFETTLRQEFSSQRLNAAMQILNRYGPEEGLRRLKESDPEIAKPFQRLIENPQETD